MQELEGAMRAYPWGSHTLIAQLRGRETPTEHPEAELWFGAHPMNSARLAGVSLNEIIARDPESALGSRLRATSGDSLPFLLKLLAADEPLSLQAHPSLEQARSGFERENAAGIPLNADSRNYKDPNHKPELLVALTPFSAMAGFRPVDLTRRLLEQLDCPELDRYIPLLDPASPGESLRTLFTTWITIPVSVCSSLIDAVVASARGLSHRSDWVGTTLTHMLELNERYPGDAGILISLMLNHIDVEPGEGLFLGAGQLHAYFRGLGVELMASSDNVLRGGLTSKHVDVPELMRVVDFTPNPDPVIHSVKGHFEVPVKDFTLFSADAPAEGSGVPPTRSSSLRAPGYPAIVLCTSGNVRLSTQGQPTPTGDPGNLVLQPGQAAWVPACDPDFYLSGGGHYYLATSPAPDL